MNQPRGTKIGNYNILSMIGQGSMGVVYRAQDPSIGKQVAIKTVTETFDKDPAMLQRCLAKFREAVATLGHQHSNILAYYGFGDQDGIPYIVTEFVEGDTLDALAQSNRPLPLIGKLDVIRQVCAGLGYAHQMGIVHGNVNPSKVMVCGGGHAKLFGFENLRLFESRMVVGAQVYLAPEYVMGNAHDGRSDIFAAGVVLFQLLTGSLPFGGPIGYLMRLINDKQPPLGGFLQHYPPALDVILDRSLSKNPVDRYQTADEMATDLNSVIETLKHEATVQ